MPRGNAEQVKIHYKGKEDDFIIFGDSVEAVQQWKNDSSTPLAQVVSGFKVLVSHKHGAQGELDTASKSVMENEFGTSNDDEVIKQILERGSVQATTNKERTGGTNDTMGGLVSH